MLELTNAQIGGWLGQFLLPLFRIASMLMVMPWSSSTWVKAALVNCDPWSLLNTSGRPWVRRASSRQATQNPASRVLAIRQASTRRAYQSMTATR